MTNLAPHQLLDRPPTERPELTGPSLAAVDFEAPYVIEKLVKDHIVDTVGEAERLFTEAKRFIVLSQSDPDVICEMYSVRVDEAWHQFILYTAEYMDFCQRFFGRYVPHSPNNAPQQPSTGDRERLTFDEFKARYEAMFGEPLPDVWYDQRNVTASRRVFHDTVTKVSISRHDGQCDLRDDAGDLVLSVNDLAHPALEFIARTAVFYVRELPGELTDEEKVALVEALLAARVLRPAS
ncbi:glycine-rich domain-containing protein [Streptomyces sp. NPDC002908]|uniref:glycine-rich domain-containing protein n=1 Tax=Streptomyces sp. NPDC002908 TaxID=3364670 RepID=UPI0036C95735